MEGLSRNVVVLRDDLRARWIRYGNPREIVQAADLGAVLPAVQRIELLVETEGLHAAGFISYEASHAFDTALTVKQSRGVPLLWFGLYEHFEEIDPPRGDGAPILPAEGWKPSVSRECYLQAVERVRAYIRDGDTYQANYTYRLNAPCDIEPWPFFLRLVGSEPPPFATFIQTEDWAVASASPELFFDLHEGRIRSRPMKGTASRGRTLVEDRERARWLASSEKDRAENLMIVDMARNDIGRAAVTGTVAVDELFGIEKYPTVWQMTSTVSARTEVGFTEILKTMFPPASITGAPKARTMEIIAELETTPRGVYTGAIGFASPGQRMQFNVAIRTAWIDRRNRTAEYGIGGGIVWDSRPELELEESRVKARILGRAPVGFSLLETILWTSEKGYALLDRHRQRLVESSEYFTFAVDMGAVDRELQRIAGSLPAWPHRVRLLVERDGRVSVEATPLDPAGAGPSRRVCLAPSPVDASDPFLFHKTTHRRVYDDARAACPGFDDVILWNRNGEVTESCIANVVVEIGGYLFTPPTDCGLLAGTYRGQLLDDGRVAERVITIEELRASPRVLLVSSVRGEVEVHIASLPAAASAGSARGI